MGVVSEPNVQGCSDDMSAWKCFKHTRKNVLQELLQVPPAECIPLQQLPPKSKPLSFANELSLNSNTPDPETYWEL